MKMHKSMFAAVAAICAAAMPSFADNPYDAKVEYLESPMGSDGKNPYIDTDLYPGDDMGAHIRFMPLRTTDSTLCGAQTTGNNKWYFGGTTGSSGVMHIWYNIQHSSIDDPKKLEERI